MKRALIPVSVLLFLVFGLGSSLGDTYWRTYEVVAKSADSLTLVDSDGTQVEVNKDPENYEVGYKVRYDDVRDVLKKDRWQDYTVRKVSSNSITLVHKSGDTLKLESGDLKTRIGKFKKDDKVSYDSVDRHLKLTE